MNPEGHGHEAGHCQHIDEFKAVREWGHQEDK